jgi:hypothetical protein
LVQDRGGAEFQTGGILLYVEDLRRGTNKDIGPKDIFEMASKALVSFRPVKPGSFQQTDYSLKKPHHTKMHNATESKIAIK